MGAFLGRCSAWVRVSARTWRFVGNAPSCGEAWELFGDRCAGLEKVVLPDFEVPNPNAGGTDWRAFG